MYEKTTLGTLDVAQLPGGTDNLLCDKLIKKRWYYRLFLRLLGG